MASGHLDTDNAADELLVSESLPKCQGLIKTETAVYQNPTDPRRRDVLTTSFSIGAKAAEQGIDVN